MKGRQDAKGLKILMVNWEGAQQALGGDSVHMFNLKRGLEALGAQVDVDYSFEPDGSDYDLATVFNCVQPHAELPQMAALKRAGIPIFLFPIYMDHAETKWGELASFAIFGQPLADDVREQYLAHMATGDIQINGVGPKQPPDQDIGKVVAQADHILAISYQEIRALHRDFGVHRIPFTITPHAVEPSVFGKVPPNLFTERFGVKDFVLCSGRLEPRKNQLLLLHALKDSGLPIVLAGGSSRPDYLELCKRYAPPTALFVGQLDREMMASAYAAARVHALTSWIEGCSLATLEAAISGANIVVGDRGSELEYFGSLAYYCNPASVASIRSAVLRAYENCDTDGARRCQLRQLVAERYNWTETTRKTLEGYSLYV